MLGNSKHPNPWLALYHVYPILIYLAFIRTGKKTLLKNNKATGPDGTSPKLLKLAGTTVVGPLTSLFMQSIRECRVYNNWKVARLTPVFSRKDDPAVMRNYRPLSLVSVPSKILESCVADVIARHVFLPKRKIDRAITHPPDWNSATNNW